MKYLRVLSIVLCFIFQLVSGAYIPAGGNPNDEPVITDLMVFEVSEKSATTGEVSMLGKIEIGLFGKVVPKTVENFLGLTPMYKETKTLFHRVIPDFVIQGGDFDGKGGHSIFGERGSFGSKFNPMYSGLEDENFSISHDKIGRVSVANAGQNTGGSQFFICLTPQQGLDGKYVVFGQVISGMDIAELIAHVERDATDKPINDIFISDAYTEPYSDTSKAGLSTSSNANDHDNDASEKSQQESETPAKTTGDGVAPLDPIDNVHDGLNEESYLKDHPSGYGGSSHHFVIIPFVLFAGIAGFMAYKNRRNVTSMIRGPRYRRVAGMNT